jgi:hypothetical protein
MKHVLSRPLDAKLSNFQLQLAISSQLIVFAKISEAANHLVQLKIQRKQILLKVKCFKNFLGTWP